MDQHDKDDWIWEDEPDVQGPPPRLMGKGPDAMRQGAITGAGTGRPFIFLANGDLVWGDGVGHESMLTPKFPKFKKIIEDAFPDPEMYRKVGEESSMGGEPFADHYELRRYLQRVALFGRLGSVSGYNLLALWPGTENFGTLLPALIDTLKEKGEISDSTRISVGRSVKYTVGYFLKKKAEVMGQLKKDNDADAALLTKGPGVPSAAQIKAGRDLDKKNAEEGKGFQYLYRWGEGFGDWLRGQ